ncbi:MAG TPA: molecular chaperone HscC [Rhodanobacteraceae bacterium]|nr:molecular chaperone HscC [Rhodanobacteraceae bacterium]
MIVGIDLGTTHSLIGHFSEDGSRLFSNALGELLTPSVVSVGDDGHMIVGAAAQDRLISHPQTTVANFKRWMGSARETRLGERSFRPEELSSLLLRSLLADAQAATGEPICEAVISVPAYFSDAQRRSTRAAGELAGIKVERLINEPTAAALAYGLQQRPDGSRFLVIDLGGGTFDVSVLEMFDGVVEVHASAGDNFLGGEDFLSLLEEAFLADHNIDAAQLPAAQRAQLRRWLEAAKRSLSQKALAAVSGELGDRAVTWQIGQARFAKLAEPLLQRMRTPLERALRDANLQPGQIDDIVLVGGASRMPMVAQLATRMFGRLPLRHIHPDEAIARGACVAAGLKARDQRLDEIILTDVCPYTLGTEVTRRDERGRLMGGFYSPIIPRNCTIPTSREASYWPATEGQTCINLDVYQGESPLVANNVKLGELSVAVDPRVPREQNEVRVRYTYDSNGVLQVEAFVLSSGAHHELVLEQNPGLLDAEEIRQRLAALAELKTHPRDKQENIALLARAERLYEEHLVAREELQEWIARFRGVMDGQDEQEIREHRLALSRALDSLEPA